jgi:UDP-2,4-diacetamido-2,4,6-trideoxy-beta-L-altropyranose hydrolase
VTRPALLVIRADASERIGSGHVMRCLALAEQWAARGGEVRFVCRPLRGHLMTELRARGYMAHSLPLEGLDPYWDEGDLRADAQATRDLLQELVRSHAPRSAWLLVDHYHIDAHWHGAVAQEGLRIAALDDLADRPMQCDLLIDQNALTHLHDRYRVLTPADCRLLLGADFTLLRQDVRLAANERPPGGGRSVLIFLGGADNEQHTEKILAHWTRQAFEGLTAHVLCGSMNPRWKQLKAACKESRVGFSRAQRGIGKLMGRARAAIVACGMLAVELQALEVPSLLLPLSDIQRAVALDFERRGRAVVLEPDRLTRAVAFDEAWRRTLAMEHTPTGRGIIPLNGASRVVDILMDIES